MLPTNVARRKQLRIDALEIGWLALAIVIPLAINPWGSNAFELPKAALLKALVLLMLLVALFRFSTQRATRPRIDWNILALAITFTLATIFSYSPRASLWGDYARQQGLLTTFAYLALFVICSVQLRARDPVDRLWRALIWPSAPIVFYALAQAFGIDPFDWHSDASSPLVSTLGRSNFVGTYTVLIFPLTLARFFHSSRKPIYALLIAAQMLCLVLTQARGAWLGAAGALVTMIFVWAIIHRNRRIVIALVALGLSAIALATFLIGWKPQTMIAQTSSGSTAARLTIWQTTMPLIASHPMLGYGPETMQFAFVQVFPPQLVYYQGRQFAVDRAHNMWLDLAMSAGGLGVVCFIALLIELARDAWNRWRNVSELAEAAPTPPIHLGVGAQAANLDRWEHFLWIGLAASIIGHLIDLQFAFDVTATATTFWLILALIAAMSRGLNAPSSTETIRPRWTTLLPFAPAATLGVLIIGTICVRPLIADVAFRESQIGTRSLPEQIASAERATQVWSLEPEYHLRLGWLYAEAGTLANAEIEFAEVERLGPDQPRIWATRGDVYARLRQYLQAESAYRRAIALAPNIGVYHSALGWALEQQQQLAPAAVELRRAVDLDATDAMAYEELGKVYTLLGREAEATWAWQEAERWRDK